MTERGGRPKAQDYVPEHYYEAAALSRAHAIEAAKYNAAFALKVDEICAAGSWHCFRPDNPYGHDWHSLKRGRILPVKAVRNLFALVQAARFENLQLRQSGVLAWPLVMPLAGAQPLPKEATGEDAGQRHAPEMKRAAGWQ
jgi:hypothetical protein